ncbi:phosphoribosylformylglycinamidine cyclo-ligase [Nitrosophilus kaiyonis]|uniref:phosphoribosylformylglycinamidine cyclo-ligase n=1 Tax=Nitrosophilus kaiyonis TaxID=2930200 RepID=UPI0024900183|nr:phosphoribosylformylglycinamidine cyclo-ligase [Nitrosophilus kaiyonis]
MKINYKESGVDIDAGAKLVEEIKPFVKETFNKNVLTSLGGFAGGFEIPTNYKNPVLFGATDGVGTKLKLAIESKIYDSVGIDLVAMCVNDLICSFADPIFFLDYYATGKLDVDAAKDVIKGIAKGCLEAECALIGGETAEMPGMYSNEDFDLAGFAVGIAEKEELQKERDIKPGDVLIALKSSGIHSNGYSLVRRLFFDELKWHLHSDFNGKPLVEVLLEPTKIYVKTYKKVKDKIKALAHITGGGIVENLPRVLPENVRAVVRKNHIEPLEIFDFISKYVDEEEMFRTFNMGVGMILIVDEENVKDVMRLSGGYILGELVEGEKGVDIIE